MRRVVRIGCFWLLIVCAALLLIDVASILGWYTNDDRQEKCGREQTQFTHNLPVSSATQEFLEKQYENAVKEIQIRIEQENLLFGFKFSLVGAILALLFITYLKRFSPHRLDRVSPFIFQSHIAALFCWAAVITSAIIDSRILYHANITVELGTWIKFHVEPLIYSLADLGWEGHIVQHSLLFNSPTYALLRLNTTLLTLILFISTAYIFSDIFFVTHSKTNKDSQQKLTSRVCRAGSMVSFFVFFLVSIHFHFMHPVFILIIGMITLIGWLMSLVTWSISKDWSTKILDSSNKQ